MTLISRARGALKIALFVLAGSCAACSAPTSSTATVQFPQSVLSAVNTSTAWTKTNAGPTPDQDGPLWANLGTQRDVKAGIQDLFEFFKTGNSPLETFGYILSHPPRGGQLNGNLGTGDSSEASGHQPLYYVAFSEAASPVGAPRGMSPSIILYTVVANNQGGAVVRIDGTWTVCQADDNCSLGAIHQLTDSDSLASIDPRNPTS